MFEDVRRRRWKFIGHIMSKESNNDCRTALTWTPRRVMKMEQTKDNMEKHHEKKLDHGRTGVRNKSSD